MLGLFTTLGCSNLTQERRIREPIQVDYSIQSTEFRDSVGNLLGASMVEGNNVVELLNGDQIFGEMLKAMRTAQKTITHETFIWSSGKVSDSFVEVLSERAKAGVKVHVIIDAFGSNKLKKKDIKRMRDAGVQIHKYNSPVSLRFFRFNHRTHRKITVVDGRVGFIGGVCMADEWQGQGQAPYWRDTHFRVEGPVVGQIQGVFIDNWLQVRSEILEGKDYFPNISDQGGMLAQCFKSGPREGSESARLTYLLAFAAAKKSIRIAHGYFVPDNMVRDAIIAARKRGVKVEIIFPKKIDNMATRKATWATLGAFLDAGVKFYEFNTTLYHCKIVIVDDVWATVGSVNFDDRSMRINDEANLNVLDEKFAAQLIKTFEADKAQSSELLKETFKKRSIVSRFFDHFAGLFKSQL
jgi:cardiolipin synthase